MSSQPSESFLERRRKHADAPEMERDEKSGQFKGAKGHRQNLAAICREILSQPKHVAMLKLQARNGVGTAPDQLPPATHKLLLERGWGLPPKAKEDDEAERAQMKALRDGAKAFLKERYEEAKIVDISLHHAAAALKAPPKTDSGESAVPKEAEDDDSAT